MNLTRKYGPLPLWAWLALGALLGYLAYRFASGKGGSSGQAVQTRQVLPTTTDQATGLAPQAGSPGDTGQGTSDLVAALGGQQAQLLSSLEALSSDVSGLAASQIAAAQTQTAYGSFNQNTQPTLSTDPNSNTPSISYVMPQVSVTPQPAPPATVTPRKPAAISTPTKFYTYKRDVPLSGGKTVHFASGRGYYAA